MSNRTITPLSPAEGVMLALAGYRMLARHPLLFLRLACPWVLAGVSVAALDRAWADYVFATIGWLAWAAISVAWCRLILLSAPCPIGGRLGRRELRYILVALPMLAAGVLVVCVSVVLLGAAEVLFRTKFEDLLDDSWFLFATAVAGLLAYLVSVTRFQLMFPAIAVNDHPMTFRSSLRLTRGSAFAIFIGSLIASAPLLAPSLGWWLPADAPPSFSLAVANGLDALASTVSAAVVAGFCAQLYRRQYGRLASIFE